MNLEESYIPALSFELKKPKLFKAFLKGKINKLGYWKPGGPVSLKKVPFPKLINEEWLLIKTKFCGICGSDMSEIQLKGSLDNPIRSFISFPQIMGHEVVGTVFKAGEKVEGLKIGDRVAINPWLSCKARGIDPVCFRCSIGDNKHCRNFQRGVLPAGMHLGVTRGFGGYSPYLAVHESQCFLIPEDITFEQAVLADPFSVAFHSILMVDPLPQSTVLIYGLGIIGLLCVACLKVIFKVDNIIAIGRYQFQSEFALKLGAKRVFLESNELLISEIAAYLNLELYTPEKGLKWTMDGPDYVIDTIGSAESLELGIRILACQGKLVFLGVNKPMRFENTLHYFKELEVMGSNSFGIETYNGSEKHAFDHFLQFLKEKLLDPSILITHKFPLKNYILAFNALAEKSRTSAVKVLFEFVD